MLYCSEIGLNRSVVVVLLNKGPPSAVSVEWLVYVS
jgi:hypothetical protein